MSTPGEYLAADDRQQTLHAMRTLAAYVALWRQALGEAGIHGQAQDDLTLAWYQHTMAQNASTSVVDAMNKAFKDLLDGIGEGGGE